MTVSCEMKRANSRSKIIKATDQTRLQSRVQMESRPIGRSDYKQLRGISKKNEK